MAAFWYNTAVYPISLETSSNRMLLNLDGTVTMQCGETEIGQGADTAYAQMTAEAVGLKSYRDVRVVSEVVSSNGSTSQGSICGSTLALTPAARPMWPASPSARRRPCCGRRS